MYGVELVPLAEVVDYPAGSVAVEVDPLLSMITDLARW